MHAHPRMQTSKSVTPTDPCAGEGGPSLPRLEGGPSLPCLEGGPSLPRLEGGTSLPRLEGEPSLPRLCNLWSGRPLVVAVALTPLHIPCLHLHPRYSTLPAHCPPPHQTDATINIFIVDQTTLPKTTSCQNNQLWVCRFITTAGNSQS